MHYVASCRLYICERVAFFFIIYFGLPYIRYYIKLRHELRPNKLRKKMPPYEVAVIIKSALQRPELRSALKRACQSIYNRGGIIRKMENLGSKELPYPMKKHSETHYHGNYFIIRFDSSVQTMFGLKQEYGEDTNIIRAGFVKNESEPRRPCLDGPCLFGELPNPEHDKSAYKKRVLRSLKNRRFTNL